MNKERFLKKLRGYIAEEFVTQSNAARHYGVSRAFMSAMVTGKKRVIPEILADMGYRDERTVIYKYFKV